MKKETNTKIIFEKRKINKSKQDLILNYENEFSEDVDLYLMKMWLFSEENKVQET